MNKINKRPADKLLTLNQVVNAMENRKIIDVHNKTGVAKRTVSKLFEDNANEVAYNTRTINKLSAYVLDDLERLAAVCGAEIAY